MLLRPFISGVRLSFVIIIIRWFAVPSSISLFFFIVAIYDRRSPQDKRRSVVDKIVLLILIDLECCVRGSSIVI